MVSFNQSAFGKKSASKMAIYSPFATSKPSFKAPALKPCRLVLVICLMSIPSLANCST